MRSLRRFLPSEIYFVTIRTIEQRFALDPYACPGAWVEADGKQLDFDAKQIMRERGRACVEKTAALTKAIARSEQDPALPRPEVAYDAFTDSIPNIIGSCLARGVAMFGVHVFGFVWMSNHGHLLLRAPKGNMADFMAYLNGQIAVNANRFLGRKHPLWDRRYAAAQVLDEAAELDMLGYVLANPQNAGIARSINEWQGLSSAVFFFQNREQRFLVFNRTAWHKEGRPRDIGPFLSTVVLEHQWLPQLLKLEPKELRRRLRLVIKQQSSSTGHGNKRGRLHPETPEHRHAPTRVVIPTERPESAMGNPRRRSPQPLCHTTKRSLRIIYKKWHGEFRIAYKRSSEDYRRGNTNVVFPPGSFAPSKYPRARYAHDLDINAMLHPTRKNLEKADALKSLAA